MMDWALDPLSSGIPLDADQSVRDILRPMATASIQGRDLVFNLLRQGSVALSSR